MKKTFALVLSLVLLVSCLGSAGALNFWTQSFSDAGSGTTTWAIYWYVCGSDLETEHGCASTDLREMMSVTLPENVTVVVQTGGAEQWDIEDISADEIGRYVYVEDSMYLVDELPQANMGDRETLESFLSFCAENYPADKEMVIFWDHGGGSCGGVCADENYDGDFLTIRDLHAALSDVFSPDSENPPLEFVGFDTCLMGSLENAAAMEGIAHYMIASEETEPGCGWAYDKFLSGLIRNTDMDSEDFGRIVCDTYMEGCEDVDQDDKATLSLVDLTKLPALLDAYEAFGQEAMENAGPSFYSSFGRGARKAENYGGNTKHSGFTDMVDLGDLIINNVALFPETAEAVISALEDCVLYSRSGDFRTRATGLSCFYPYSGDVDRLAAYIQNGFAEAMPSFFRQMLLGSEEEAQNSTGGGSWFSFFYGSQEQEPETTGSGWLDQVFTDFGHSEPVVELPEDMEVEMDDDLVAHLSVPEDVLDLLSGLYIQMYCFDMDRDTLVYLGRDTNLSGSWDDGEFSAEFRGTWGSIDGHICYMEPVFESLDYNIYQVPVLLNGEQCQLIVTYNYETGSYKITGAQEGLEEGLLAGKRVIPLRPGDVLTTIVYTSSMDDDSEYVYSEEYETFTVTEDTCFADDFLPDGWYYMPFELVDYRSNSVTTDSVIYALEDGNISLVED